MTFRNNVLSLGRRGGRSLLTYDQRCVQKGGGVKIQFGHPQSLDKIHCSAYSLDTNPLRLVGFTTEMFSMKADQKLYTQSNNFTHSVG